MFLESFSLTRWEQSETWMQNYSVNLPAEMCLRYPCSLSLLISAILDLSESHGHARFYERGVRALLQDRSHERACFLREGRD